MDDEAERLFAELTPSTSGKKVENDSSKEIDGEKKVIGRAWGIEITVPSNISVSTKQQNQIDKLLSDVAHILRRDQKDDSPMETNDLWFCSGRGDIVKDEDENGSDDNAPKFRTSFGISLNESVTTKENAQSAEAARLNPPMVCFNCEGSHSVSECPEQKDYAKIKRNRSLHQQSTPSSAGLYHKNAKFDKYVPGEISDVLREALGLHTQDVPPWIYEMRILGYPPGYFRSLLTPEKKLVMYNELQNGSLNEQDTELDPVDLVKYPGFNVPLPENANDKAIRLGYPPMLPQHAKDHFLSYISKITGKKIAGPKDDVMLLDDDEKEIPRAVSTKSSTNSKSPSLEELERQRRMLEKQLLGQSPADSRDESPPSKRRRLISNDNNTTTANGGDYSSSNSIQEGDAVDLTSPDSSPTQDGTGESFLSPKMIPLVGEDAAESTASSSSNLNTSRSLSVHSGTPVHDRVLTGGKPQLDKFASGIQPFATREVVVSQDGQGYKKLKKIISKKK